MFRTVLCVVAVFVGASGSFLAMSAPHEKKDPFPNGCVSCHGKTPDGKDVRLNLEIKKIAKHPNIATVVKVVPSDCAKCHKPEGKTQPLSVVVHKSHYGKGEKGVFVTQFKGDCNACHVLDSKTFKMGVKSGAKNW